MIVYEPSTPRTALGVAAAAMAAVTMAVMVVLPAELEASGTPERTEARVTGVPIAAAIPSVSVDVADALASEDDAPPGHVALEMSEPCVHPGMSSVSPRNRT